MCLVQEANPQPTLKNVSLNIGTGDLMVVVGPVAAGKSSLLLALLGEMPLSEGKVKAIGRLAYVSQQPWIFSASVRQNILFGAPFDKNKYDIAIRGSALKKVISTQQVGEVIIVSAVLSRIWR
jgi:ATP-binding cassette subfamily C (CFTR/MRP) protein 4